MSFTNKKNIVRPQGKKQDFTQLWQTFRANGSFISFTNKVISFQHYASPDRHRDLPSFTQWAHFWASEFLLSLANVAFGNAESSASRRRILLNYAESSRETQNPLMLTQNPLTMYTVGIMLWHTSVWPYNARLKLNARWLNGHLKAIRFVVILIFSLA